MSDTHAERQLEAIAALAHPLRRRLYLHVSSQAGDVTREEAAEAIGITRPAATFHLEKLVEDGLLDATYRRVSGRGGPGAGRPPRVYRGPARDIRVQIPPRDYELLARLILDGLGQTRTSAPQGSHEAARDHGASIGAEARRRAGKRPNRERLLQALIATLRDQGYQPQTEGGDLRLSNCPFHALSRDYRDFVCPTNLSMMHGVLEALRVRNVKAVLDPQPGMCCVAFPSEPR